MHKGAEENQYLESQLIEQDEQDARMERERGRRDTEVREGSPDVALQIQFAQVEEGIRAFKEATGCTDIADVAGKFKTQWETVERLSEAMAGNEQTCETLKDELAKVTKVLQRAKFASAEPESGSRVGELEAQLQAARRQKEDLRKEYVAADTFLETVVDGVQYLYDRLHNSGKVGVERA